MYICVYLYVCGAWPVFYVSESDLLPKGVIQPRGRLNLKDVLDIIVYHWKLHPPLGIRCGSDTW